MQSNTPLPATTPERKSAPVLVWILGGVVVALAITNGFLFTRVSGLDAQITQMQSENRAQLEIARQQSASLITQLRGTIEGINQQVADSRTKAAFDATRAKTAAQQHAEKLMQTLADQQRLQQQSLTEEIGVVKQETEASKARMSEVATEVGAVKTEVATTRSTLDSALADLKTVRGDLGVQSGLIATNAEQLAALKQLGERNYYEFNLTKSSQVKLGGIVLSLKKADTKRNKFNLEVVADDKRVEKKDKTINEPVQFYVSGARQPYEIVVNQVGKDRVAGYLSTPKMISARR
jgi:chromosome segregation ATPase